MEVNKEKCKDDLICACRDCQYNLYSYCQADYVFINENGKCRTYKKKKEKTNEQV